MVRYFIYVLVLFSTSCTNIEKNSSPNIVIIFMDDLGYGDISNFGAINYKTPNIDRMANQGMLFTNFYSAQAVCSASRAGLLTGTYPNRIGISGALMPYSKKGLHKDEITIAEMLRDEGYATGIFGKWHLGHQKKFLPNNHGFDTYLGIPYSNDMWPVDFDGNQISDTSSWKKKTYPQLPLIQDFEKVKEIKTLEDQSILTTLYTEKSVEFINNNKDRPFFLYLPHSMPHVPIAVSEKFLGKSKQGLYGDLMMEIDWSVGEIIKSIESNNLSENTLIIFTSDNGPWLNFGNHAGSTGGLREGKGTSFEGGQRVPTVMMWDGVIPKGKIANQLSSTIDILPTIAHITGGKLPGHKIDGVNIFDILNGGEEEPRDHFYYYYGNNNLEAVRKDNWKLLLPHSSRSYKGVLPKNDGHGGPYSRIETGLELYNLRRDPGEEYDVIKLYPDIAKELLDLAEIARTDMGDNLTGRKGSNIRKSGKL
ncbi:MAG: sulfatase [Cytophagales bacterium]|nr:sulfatase [Cytophagales bacterium]